MAYTTGIVGRGQDWTFLENARQITGANGVQEYALRAYLRTKSMCVFHKHDRIVDFLTPTLIKSQQCERE